MKREKLKKQIVIILITLFITTTILPSVFGKIMTNNDNTPPKVPEYRGKERIGGFVYYKWRVWDPDYHEELSRYDLVQLEIDWGDGSPHEFTEFKCASPADFKVYHKFNRQDTQETFEIQARAIDECGAQSDFCESIKITLTKNFGNPKILVKPLDFYNLFDLNNNKLHRILELLKISS